MAHWILGCLFCCALVVRSVRSQECLSKSVGLCDNNGIPYYHFQATSYSTNCFQKKLNKDDGVTWCSLPEKANQSYIEVDLGDKYSLCAVSTQGDKTSKSYTKQYKLKLSLDRINWSFYQENYTDKLFSGNNDWSSVVIHNFISNEQARFVRFYPDKYETNACLKVELYGEKLPKGTCHETIFSTQNVYITASSNLTAGKHFGILNGNQSWCPNMDTNPYLHIDFESYSVVCAVAVQDTNLSNPEMAYQFQFKNKNNWTIYKENMKNKTFFGSEVYILHKRVLSRNIRFTISGVKGCLLFKIYGYSYEDLLSEDVGLKFEDKNDTKTFPDESLATSTAAFSGKYPPWYGRLYEPKSAWCPKGTSYIELILVEKYYIFAVSVQGYWYKYLKYYFPTKYRISYSDNYQDWYQHPSQINTSSENVVDKYSFQQPIQARVFRIDNFDSLCLKVELHGVATAKSEYCDKQYPLGLCDYNEKGHIKDESITVSSELGPANEGVYARLRDEDCWCAEAEPKQFIKIDLQEMVTISGISSQKCKDGYVTEYQIRYNYDGTTSWYYYMYQENVITTFQANSSSGGKDAILANWLNPFLIARNIQINIMNYKDKPCLQLELYGCRDDGSPVIENYTETKELNRTKGVNITLSCVIRGQPGMMVEWTRIGARTELVENSHFEKTNTDFPTHHTISGVVESKLTIIYTSDLDIHGKFNCTKSENNCRILFCRSVYVCSARYPGATTKAQKDVTVTVTPNLILADVPGKPRVNNISHESAVVSWEISIDHLESRITEYVVQLLNESGHIIRNVTIPSEYGKINGIRTVSLSNLLEFTTYSVRIAAVNAISKSNFTEKVMFFTFLRATVSVNQHNILVVKVNQENVSITCTGLSYPKPYVSWKRNGMELSIINTTATANQTTIYQMVEESEKNNKTSTVIEVKSTLFLRPTGITYGDYGNYICEVLNAKESNISVHKIVEIIFLPRILEGPRSQEVLEGNNTHLSCNADGRPRPNITWDVEEEDVEMNVMYRKNGFLELQNVKSNGQYTFTVICIASNKGGNTTANATITILVKPRITNLTKSFTGLLYSNITLMCTILANPSPRVWWTKNGNVAHENNIYFRNDNRSLIIIGAQIKNEGSYSCFARSNLSSASQSLNLSLKALPKIYISADLTRKLKYKQENVSIICFGNGYPNPKATWKLNGNEIYKGVSTSNRDVYQKVITNVPNLNNVSSTLYFNQAGAKFNNSGNYTCEVSIESATDIDDKTVEVIFYPIVRAGPSDITLLEGKEAIFNCDVDGRPFPTTLWLFQNGSVRSNYSVFRNGSLKLFSVKDNEYFEGVYSCFAKNKAGVSKTSDATLTVHVPAKIVTISRAKIHQLMDNVVLECNARGDPFPLVTWTKFNDSVSLTNELKFVFSNKNQTLTIRNVSLDDRGIYICSVNNTYAQDKKNVTVYVEVSPDVSVNKSLVLLKSVNETAIIRCVGLGFPVPVVQWFRGDRLVHIKNDNTSLDVYQIIINTKPVKFLGDVVSILHVNPDHTYKQFGNYTCNATKINGKDETDLQDVEIVLVPTIKITRYPVKDTVLEGTNVQINCTADGSPKPMVKWIKYFKNSSTEVLGNVTVGKNLLVLQNVTNYNEGIYSCVAENRGKPVMKNVTLTVHVKPRIITRLHDADIENGTSHQLNCSAYGDPNVTYKWSKDGSQIIPNSEVINQNKSLKVVIVTIQSEGIYKCMVENSVGNDSTTANITVFARPEILNLPKHLTFIESQTGSLHCKGKGIPVPKLIWRKNGEKITNYTKYNITTIGGMEDRKSTLQIRNLTYDDRGNFSCTMKNRKDFQTKTTVLTVQVRPIAIARPPVTQLKLGRSVNLTCVVYGFPRPKVSWEKNGKKINHTGERYGIYWNKTGGELKWHSKLEIMNLERNDNGSYSCLLENEAGTDQTSFSLVVLEPPDRLNFSSKNLTSRSVVLQWKVIFDGNNEVTYFTLHYSSNTTKDGFRGNITVPLRNNVTTFVAKYLKPYRRYTFEMTAQNALGASKPALITIDTPQDVPSKPENVLVKALDAFTLRVSWSPPKEENGIIKEYVIYYKEKNGSKEFSNSTTSSLDWNITDLKPFTIYTIQIEAYTIKGAGNRSSFFDGQTKESTPSKPQNVKTNVTSNTSIQVSWRPPERENGIILGYTIYYKEKGKTDNNSCSVSAKIHTSEIKPLHPFTNYTFWVQANTSAGYGDNSEMVRAQTQEGVPSEPRRIRENSTTVSSVILTWDPPEHRNGELINYEIYYQKKDLVGEEDYKHVEAGTATIWTIEDLDDFTIYSVYVRARTSAGEGERSKTLQIVTLATGNKIHPGVDPLVMIPIVLHRVSSDKGNITFYRIIVVLLKKTGNEKLKNPKSYERLYSYNEIMDLTKEERYGKAYIAFAFKAEDFDKYQRFVLGNGTLFENEFSRRKRENKEYRNGKLTPGSDYAYHLRGYVNKTYFESSKQTRTSTSSKIPEERKDDSANVVMIVIIVAAVLLLLLFITAIWFRTKKRGKDRNDHQGMVNLGHPIPLLELRSYLESMDFSDEFQAIPKVMACAITEASRPTNVPKNRYRNILPYDYTRVILSNKEGVDYINANFVKGLRKPEKYIATQGPLPNTSNDFWRMVWEQECSVIAMLTGLEEDEKVKCHQYWPATPEGKIYDNICVHQTGQAVLADYTVRYFDIKNVSTEQCRKVQQLHFTSWPDHGVPMYPGPLLRFHSRFRSALVGSHPAIVHCSAGCGRTGAFIALDYILQKLDQEQDEEPMVDIMHLVREMRGQRFNMVQTQDQYELIHQLVLEAKMFAHTEIGSADVRVKSAMLRETIPGSRKTKARGEFEKLQQCMPAASCEDGSSLENVKKNRFQILPYDFNRVQLEEMTGKTDYINASLISGYQLSRNFIATQNPMSNTVDDFWRMIYEEECGVVVCISTTDEQDGFGVYWPSDGSSTYGPITVTFDEVNNDFADSGFVVTKFHLMDARDTKGNKFSVTHFHFLKWPRDDLPQATSLLQLLAEVERAQRFTGNKLMTVHCSDGCGRTGTFCAIVTTIERVKLENSLDLIMTVRNLRAQRPEMVRNETQYQFCYDAVAAFVESFNDQTYANFQSNGNGGADFQSTTVDQKNRMITKC